MSHAMLRPPAQATLVAAALAAMSTAAEPSAPFILMVLR